MSRAADVHIAYVAGLFEGEGSVGCYASNGASVVQIGMTDVEPLRRVQAVLGGRIYGPFDKKGCSKPYYNWTLYGWNRTEAVFELLRVWLSPRRREQFERTIAKAPPHNQRTPGWRNRTKTHCKHGHSLSGSNLRLIDRGKGRRERRCIACETARKRAHREARAKEVAR